MVRRSLFLLAALSLLLGSLRNRSLPGVDSGELRVTFFDVGQGDGILLEPPSGPGWLVDGGGGFGGWDAGRGEVYGELTGRGLTGLGTMVLSHPDQDHGYGLLGLLHAFPVGRLLWNAAWGRDEKRLASRLRAVADLRGVPVVELGEPRVERQGGAILALLPLGTGTTTNDRPLAVVASHGGCSLWLGGDASTEAELRLLREGRRLGLGEPTVWKVSHHGSRTSSGRAVLAAIRPPWAVISSGVGNRYGHPVPAIVEGFEVLGARVLRTDFHGFVRFTVAATGLIRCESAMGECGTRRCRLP